MTERKTKPSKRLARKFDRDYAAKLAHLYHTQERPRYRFLASSHTYEGPSIDGDRLAYELEQFAARGTWEIRDFPDRSGIQREDYDTRVFRLFVRSYFDKLCSDGVGSYRAIGIIADQFNISEQTVQDIVYRRQRKKVRRS